MEGCRAEKGGPYHSILHSSAGNFPMPFFQHCEFTNPYFIMISSVFSFFLPCLMMIALYTIIFRRLRQRERERHQRHAASTTYTSREHERISAALLSAARISRQMGKHFKDRADQILLEVRLQALRILF